MRQKWLQKPPMGTPINWSHPSTKGLVLDLEFQEGGGDLANDLSGNKNTGTLKNMASPPTTLSGWNPGKFGPAPKFDGTDDYVDCGDQDYFSPSVNNMTISFWAKVPSDAPAVGAGGGGAAGAYFITKGHTNNYEWAIENDSNTNIYFILWRYSGNVYGLCGKSMTVNDDKWHHYMMVVDYGNSLKGYIDGVEVCSDDSFSGEMSNKGQAVLIGKRGDGNPFTGQIDQVRIYNRALPAEEIQQQYINPFGRFERTKWGLLVPTAPPAGLSIPVAMHNYRRLRA